MHRKFFKSLTLIHKICSWSTYNKYNINIPISNLFNPKNITTISPHTIQDNKNLYIYIYMLAFNF